MPKLLVGLCAFCCYGACRATASQDLPTIQRWFDREWAAAAAPLDLEGNRVEWHTAQHYVPPAQELQRLRSEVRGHPDHPDRAMLDAYEARLAGTASGYLNSLWMQGTRHWRFNRSFSAIWTDQAVTPSTQGWLLAPGSLTLRGPTEETPAAEWQVEEHTFLPEVSLLLDAGLRAHRNASMNAEPVRLSGSTWNADIVLPNVGTRQKAAYRARFSGRWDESAQRGFVEKMAIVESLLKPDTVGETTQLDDWALRGSPPRWVAAKATTRSPAGRLDRVLTLREFEPEQRFSLAQLTQAPLPGHADPIRGDVLVQNVFDASKGVIRTLEPGGEAREVAIPGQQAQRSERATRTYLGWLGAAILITAVVGLGLYRRMSGK